MEIKNSQQSVKGDTATEEVTDIAPYMKAEVVRKNPSTTTGGDSPKTAGIKTPGNPSM